MEGLYIGLMSGTSLDGIDAALVHISNGNCTLVRHHTSALPSELRQTLLDACEHQTLPFEHLCTIDNLLGHQFALAANKVIAAGEKVIAIGSHGQTIAHYPSVGNSLQIGNANLIAARTGITTVTDFRRADMTQGGQGAPLTPAFHAAFMAEKSHRCVLNIGGMANITLLDGHNIRAGFDVGPGNVLLDMWIKKNRGYDYDANGDWARTGSVHTPLLARLMAINYLHEPPPKSTGREFFNEKFLEKMLLGFKLSPADVQATLTEFTAACVAHALAASPMGDIVVCGGGAHNILLMERITNRSRRLTYSSEKIGVHPDYVEAMAFAWFAREALTQQPLNLSQATGAHHNVAAGAIYPAQNLRFNFHES